MRVGIITQARMGSNRLPGKVLKEIKGEPLLKYHIDRLKESGYPVYIATSVDIKDDAIVSFAKQENLPFFRGDENNVLSRYYHCAAENNLDIIVRVTSDCPFIDPDLIKDGAAKYLKLNNPFLYLSNCLERTFARGFDFEIFSFGLLNEAFNNASEYGDMEHVTPYIWKNRSGKIKYFHVKQPENNSSLRITVDTEEDFNLIKILIVNYNAHKLSYTEIEDILNQNSQITAINSHIEQKKI